MRNTALYRFGLIVLVVGFIGCATSTPGGIDTFADQVPSADAVVQIQGVTCPT